MTVDLNKAKAGDTVKFRCGGMAVIEKVDVMRSNAQLYFKDNGSPTEYIINTGGIWGSRNNLLDITEVIPAPVAFDWSTVKTGMGVQTPFGWGWYIGRSVIDSDYCVVLFKDNSAEVYLVSDLTRAPENDVEVR